MNKTFTSHFALPKETLRLVVCGVCSIVFSFTAHSQSIDVTQANSNAAVRAYVEDVLLGSCVTVSNVSFTGDYRTSGTFDGSGTIIGLDDGIILTSGRATTAEGPDDDNNAGNNNNDPGDVDLTAIAGITTYDATVLEFDFIPSNDTLRFNYIFASEEYPEYVDGGFNDAFGFFVAGPGITGPYSAPGGFPNGSVNVALIPGTTTPVTIDNVNYGYSANEPPPGPPDGDNQAYYVDNSSGPATQYDGYTVVLTAEFVVVPCETYHIKLAVADAGDGALDSGVLLEGGSFSAGGGVTVEIETTTIPPGIYEGCADAWFIFRRVDGSDNTSAITADFSITGTATPGVDYTTLPNSITIPAGEDSILVPINATLDFVAEGPESIIVTLLDPPCACEAPASATVNIVDNDIPLDVTTSGTTTICLGQSVNLTASPVGSQTPYTSGWDSGAPAGDNVSVSPTNTTTYTYTVTDNCGGQTVTSSETITVIRPDFTVDDDEQCLDGNSFGFTNTGATGGSVTHYWTFGDGNTSNQENPIHTYAADGDYTVTHYIIFTASNCTADASALITVFPEPEITATVDQNVICSGGMDGEISTSVTGGTSGFNYSWSPGGQTTSSISGQGVGTYTVTVTDSNGCTDSDSETIIQNDSVDPTAVCQNITVQLNSSGNATISATQIDNGSSDNCGIASMVVSPNAFTCSELGANTVTLSVTDVNGNTDDCTATVTVEDNIDPVANCTNITIQLDATGNASITIGDIDAGATDNCSVTTSATLLDFTCANTGLNSVIVLATDGSGNTDNCSAQVTVQDNLAPTAICQDITVQLDGSGNATITANDVDNGSNDNCSVALSATPLSFNCADVGTNTVTLTATDPSSNSDNCTATVTVEDNIDPTVSCQNITIQLDGSGTVSITSVDVNAGSGDNCGGLAYNVTPGSFDCDDLGVNTVTLTVTDASGNVANCTADVTVQDTENPTAVCQNITVQLDASGNASITANDVDNGSDDNCSVTISATPLTFTCANVGANTVVLTATDPSSNTDNCNATVTVEDNVDPIALCQDVTLNLGASGNLLVQPTDIDNSSNDACGISGMFANPAAFDCSDVGPNAVTLTVTDNNGNQSTCVSTVTIEDDEDPTAICQDITVQLDASGNATITANDIDNGSNDNCSVSLSATTLSFDCSNVGSNTVTLTATDPSGNTDDCTATITIEDNVDPTAVCQDITVQLDAFGNASIVASDVDNGSNDNCSVTLSATPLSFTCANTGANTVTLTATDPSGNTDDCTATVTIEDNIDPTSICQNITIQLDASGNASITANDVDNGSNDNCSVSLSATPLSFDCSNVGANTVTLTATDPSGNTDDCTATVTIEDDIDPTASCVDITVQLDASGNASIVSADIDGGSTDNCSGFTVSPSPNSFTCANLGVNTVTLTVTDASGNVSTCTADVTIEDNVDPTAVCQNITVYLDGAGNASITAADVDGGSTDNCSVTVSATPLSFTCADVGANSVTLTATDQSSNTDNCTATVTVADTTSPTAVCQDITIQLDGSGNATISAADVDNGSTDNCAVASLVVSPNAFTCAEVGANTVTFTVTDVNGNTSTCTATVTVEDDIDPTAVCQDITVQLDANGDLTIASADIDGGSSDNCGIASLTIDGGNTTQDFDCSNVGANTVTLTVTDVNGNVSTCDATLTVADTIDPSAVCQDITIQLDASGNASIATTDIDNGSSDACGIASITLDGGAASLDFDCSDVGVQTVMLTVTDVNGNVSTCTADVTVEDNVDPSAVCQDITVQLDASGSVTVSTADIDNGSSDACGIATITLDGGAASLDFDCSDVGVQTVTLTVTDVNGNVSTCTADVTVQDTIDPTAVCQDITVQLDASGNASVSTVDIDNGSNDNCGIASITLDGGAASLDFDCSDVGVQTVTLTVTDVNGNVSTCTADVTVEDNINPTALCQDITVQLDANGDLTIVSADIDGGSADNCGIASLTIDGGNTSQDFDCSNVGANTVTLTVTDVNGNVSTCDATVTVADTVSPTAVCQDITVQLDGNGDLTITSADVDGGSTDACGIASLEIDGGNTSQDFDCLNVGTNTVTLTVTDVNGNVSTCDATVTIQDTIDPTAVCQDITIQLDASGNASVSTVDIDNGSNDNCGIASITLDGGAASLDFDCSDVGVQTVTLTVTDVNGNISTCTADVTVEDNIDPTALCQNITIQLDASGNASISTVDIDNGSNDNCGIASITLDGGTSSLDFDCSDVGVQTVTLTVTDVNGNVSTCTADVTVEDNIDPTAICQDITIQLDASGNASISTVDIDNGSNDNCGIASITLDGGAASLDFDCSDVGVQTVTLTVTDVNGNVSTCTADVTVQDTVSPTAICQDITVQLDASGNVVVTTVDIDNGSNDNCGIASITLDGGASSLNFDCSDEGVNTVTLTVTDVNGNISTCTADVTVENNIIPTVACQDITVYLDATGNVSIVAADVDGGSNAACGIASLTIDQDAFTCANVGANTVTLTGTDNSGNVSTCTSAVTVLDTISPDAICQDITVQLDASGNLTITSADIDGGSADNCAVATLTIDGGNTTQDFDCSNVGTNTVTLTVTDVNANVSTCDAAVTVQDTINPSAVCQDITVQLDANGDLTIVSADIDGGSADNCGIASLTIDGGNTSQDFACANVGTNTVTLTVTDVNGNVSTCDATVTVSDTVSPNAVCQDITVQLDSNGDLTITSADIDGGSTDACGIASLEIDGGNTTQDFDCSDVGTTTVTLTLTDVNGNVSTCDATVTIEDNVDPTAVCQDITVQLDANGDLTIASADIDGGSTDNCGVASLTIDGGNTTQDFDCSNVGINTVTLTVTDVNGNVSTCDATVTIEDNVDPTAVCQDITIQLDAAGNASISTVDIDNGSNDNCGIASIALDGGAASLDFDCSNVGVNTVTLTVTDVNGNTSTCTADVTVQDTIDATAVCQDITVQLDATGNATITGADVDGGSTDNCGVASLDVSPGVFDCSNVGVNTVTLTVTDDNGNTSTCTADVTIGDNVDPNAVCQDITIYVDAAGDVTIVAADVDGGSTDNCAIDNIAIDDDAFDCNDLGTNLVTLTVTDVNGNVSTCTSTVTVLDTVSPTPVCQDIVAELDATGNISVAPGDVDNGSFDNCAIASITLDPNTFTCAEVGFNTVTLTVTDASGNVSTCDAQVDVQDNVLPGAVCQDITVQLDASGNAIITPVMVDNGSTDACGSVTPTIVSPSSFDCSNVGVNIVTLTVEDQNGNISTCASTVTIQDTVNPIAVCQDITVQLDATGNASIVPADVDGGSSDNCAIDNMTVSPNSFTCAEEGANTVTLTVTDVNGNVSTCDATVTVENNVIPTVSCQDITVYLDGAGAVSITASDVDGGSNAACGIASLTVDPSAFTCAEVGANTVTLTGTDNSGNVSTCTATVTVVDTISPAAVCQDITIQLDASGNASIVAADVDGGSTDNCAIATLSATPTAFGCAEVGANTVTLTVTDVNGNISTCDATVTVEDDIDPTIVCQNITVELDATGNVSITGIDIDNGTTDNCSTVGSTLTLDVTPSDFDCNNVGSNTVTLTATDENGNSSTCTATVTVQDNEAPIALCQDITIYLDGAGSVSITPADIDNGSTDNCAIDNMVVTPNSFSCSGVGANPVTLTVTDVNGNVGSCISTVTVLDTISPSAVCQDITVQLDASGNASIVATQVNNGSSDECGIDNIAIDVSTFDCSNVGTNTVELTVTDVNGNVSNCTSTVTIEDNVDPTAICQDITVQLDASGNASITAAQIDNGSTDNCAVASLDVTPSTFDCSNVGANTVTLTVTDVNGNTDNCTTTVTVEDNINPTAVCQDITVQLNASGNATITSADIDGGSLDNCAIASLTIDGGSTTQDFDCSEVGTNTVTLTVTDVNGNVSTCDATVTVQDTVSPTAVCQDITVQLDATGNLIITSADVDGGSNDNCSIASLEIDNGNTTQAFDCTNIGTNTVTLTVTDVNGNVSTCDATVTVQDTVTPVIVCQDITVQLDANGEATITGVDLDGGTSDNCSQPVDITFTSDVTDFDCSNVGVNTVTLTATDANGNVSTCTADVTVEDNVDPTAVCQDITVYLDGTGNVSIVAADVDGGSTDNCGIDNLAVNQDAFVCAEVGANTVTLTVTDVNGNASTCDATVTVQDTVSPIALCQDITIQLDATGNATISATDVDNGSSDNCAIASMVVSPNAFTCAEEGDNTVELTVTDVNGNVSTCTSTVTVENNVAPNVFCQDITVYLDATGNVSIIADDVNGGSNASCGLDTLTVSPSDFDCSNVGPNTVTLTAVDNSGNTSTCDATVTVLDTISPVAVCQDITVQLDAAGQLTITSADVDGGSSDNCAVASLEIDNGNTTQDFDCSNVGANTVTLTVTDVNGNVSTCDATVTVQDTVSPSAVCQDITVQLAANGELTIASADIDGGSNDNCGIASLEIDNGNTTQDFYCSQVGANTVTLTVTDVNGNVSTCDATVTVQDTVSPNAVCQDITVQLDANGELTITSTDIDGGSNDNCGIASLEIDNGNTTQDFDCTTVGANTVTLTVTDVNGNVSTCDATVTVEDTIPPTAVCDDITVDLDPNGDVVIDASTLGGSSSDNCGIASITVDSGQLNTTLDCSTVGSNTVTVTVTDVNGNVSTCDATVTVEDNENPTALCDDITVQLDANGTTIITPFLVDGGSNDNCGIDSLDVLPTSLNCNNVGTNSIVLTVWDVNGNISTCIATVTAEDTIAPTAVCTDITVQLNGNGTAVIAAGDIDDGSFDNCGIQSLSIDVNNFDCSDIGPNTVELTVTDVNGNSSTCTANANVVDEVDPNVICQNLSVYLDANGQVTITADDIDNGSTDACGIDTMTLSMYEFDCSDIGVNPVTLTVTDNYGNFDVCQAVVRVFDTIAPVAVCQDITIQLDATGTSSIVAADVDGGSTDNCGIDVISVNQTIFDCTQVGANTVTLTVIDVNGNQSTCDATVTVEDNVNPNANCQDITIYLDVAGNASINPSNINVGSNANCGVDTVFVSQMDFDCSHVGNNTVTLTVVDNNGNQSTCTANVEVLDTVAPTAICQDLTTQVNAAGEAGITAMQVDNGSFDNCGILSLVLDDRTFDCSNVGVVEVVLTVTDVNGNVSACTSNISVQDTIAPNATCTPFVVQLDANGTASITAEEVDLNSSDNCAIDTLTLNQYMFDCSEVGSNTVTLTVTDVNGNSSTCTADVIVEENIPPLTACQDITIYLDAQGDAAILPTDVDNGSTDNCAIDTMYVTPNDFTCSGVGANPVVLTVVDVNGNVSSCNAVVTVNDTISPIAICQDITVQLDTLGNASIDAEEIDNGSNDACGITGFTVDVSAFNCSNVGGNTVVLTVEDNNGNSSTCSATVTIEDNINPIANCLDLTVTLDGNGTVNVSAGEFNDSSTDNCAIDTIIASQIDFSCADLGSNIITVTVIDVNGNSATCSSELTVLDTLSPVIIACPLDTVIVPDSSDCSPQVFWTEPTATDNCTPTLTSDFVPGDNFPVGTTTVTYTATDESNNSTTCSFDITIEPSPVVVEISSPEGPCGYNLSCSAFPNGEATANVSGGCLPYDYLWTDGQTTQTATGLAAGLHGVTVTDANGTSVVQTITLTEPEPLSTDSLVSPEYVGGANISCNGEFDGAVSINVLGGEECVTYDFAWTGPNGFTSTDEDLTGLEAGTYVVVVSDASGCSYTDSITLTQPDGLNVESLVSNYNGVNISCGGAVDGWINLTISGGAMPYSVSWSNGELTEDMDSLTAGTYTYTVVDANGCEVIDSITLTEPVGLTSSITTSDYNGVNISCFGLADGSIDLTVNDGTQPYSFLWNNNEITEDIDSLEAGTYIVNIIDANGCTLTDSVTLVEPDDIVITPIDTTIISCNALEDGAFTVEAVGGVPTFTYQWSDGQTGPTADSLGAGTYIVVATDLNGCQDSIPLVLTEPAILDASVAQVADVICYGESNAIVDVNVLGGTFPYTYDWSNDSTTQDLNGVAAGVYSLEVIDANGCTDTLSVSVEQPVELTMNVDTVIDATCSGAEDGSITVEAVGGTAPYAYTWPNLSLSGATVSGLSAGVYEVVVEDVNGCSWSMNVSVGQPTSIVAQVDVQSDVSCNGLADGSALVTVSGGTGPYTYSWSNSDTDSLATGFATGTHTVTVMDAGGCDTTLTFVIDEPDVLVISVDTLYNLTCNGVNNGQAEIDVEGGTIPYNATWSSGATGYTAYNLAAGSHTVYVTDGNGCLDSLAVTITQPDTLQLVSATTTNVLCNGGDNGEATVLAQGGTAPLTYNWPLIGQTGNTATNLGAGTYTFVVTDANGCTYTDTLQIIEPEAISVTVTSDTAVCPGSGVTISASASGGSGNYSYSWDNGLGLGASHFVSPSVATTYSVEAFDQSGCSSGIVTVTVDIATPPTAAFTSSASAPCVLPTDIEFTNMSTGATNYEWFLGNGTLSSDENPTATYSNAGTYTVTLIASSGAGCSDTVTGTVIIDDVPTAGFTLSNAEGCAPLVVNFGNNSSTGLEYTWHFGDGTTSTISNPIHVYEIPGEYEVSLVVTSDGGCTDTLALEAAVSAYPSPIADFTPNQTSFPEPGNEYEFVNNSTGADLYNWEFGDGTQTDEFQPTHDYTNYGGYFITLTAINEFGCADTAVHYINVEIFTSLHVPNAMAIGEPGEASIFLPKGTGIAEYHVWIFDNWGNQLWESTRLENGSPAEGWDGYYKGQIVPQGSYVWKINAVFIDGEIWDGQEFSNGKHGNSGTIMVIY